MSTFRDEFVEVFQRARTRPAPAPRGPRPVAALQAEQTQRTTATEAATRALLAAAAQRPALETANTALVDADAAVAEQRTAVAQSRHALDELTDDLAERSTVMADLAAGRLGLTRFPPDRQGHAISMLPKIAAEAAAERRRLRTLEAELDAAEKHHAVAAAEMRAAIDGAARQDPALRDLSLAEAVAKEALRVTDAELAAAEAVRQDQLDEQEADARDTRVAALLPPAAQTLADMAPAFALVADTPIWDGADAVQATLGAGFDAFRDQSRVLTEQYQALRDAGVTTDELHTLFAAVPDLWKPPDLRTEERNWLAMKGMFTDEAVARRADDEATSVLESISSKKDIAETATSITGSMVEKIGAKLGDEEVKEITDKVGKALAATGEFFAIAVEGVEAVKSGVEMSKTEDPVERMLLEEQMLTALGNLGLAVPSLAGEIAELIGSSLPGVGVAVSGAKAMKAMAETAMHVQRRLEMADVQERALNQAHRGEPAFDQFKGREAHLLARSATDTAVNMIKAGAAGVDLAVGPGTVAGTALKGVAGGVSAAKSTAALAIDFTAAQKAKELLDQAQAGNAIARQELFRHHAKYAKGIVSVMAIEGDPFALEVISTYGLDEAMLTKSSPKIVRKYLLSKFGEKEDPTSWTDLADKVSALATAAGSAASAAAAWVGDVGVWFAEVLGLTTPTERVVQLRAYSKQMAKQSDFIVNVGKVQQLRAARSRLDSDVTGADAAKVAAIDAKIDEITAELDKASVALRNNGELLGQIHAAVLAEVEALDERQVVGEARAAADESLAVTKRLVADSATLAQVMAQAS